MTFGRPAMISSKATIKFTSLIDDEHLLKEGFGSQPPGVPSHMGLFIFSLELFDIMDDILSTFYLHGDRKLLSKQSSPAEGPLAISEILKFDSRLESFYESLPAHLNVGRATPSPIPAGSGHISLQSNILYCRCVYLTSTHFIPIVVTISDFFMSGFCS